MSLAFNAACKNCRTAKAKCLRNVDGEKCRRCSGAGWECSLMPRAARKRRKRMDARVTDLEGQLREIEGLMGRAKNGGLEDYGLDSIDGTIAVDNVSGGEMVQPMVLPLTPDSSDIQGNMASSTGCEGVLPEENLMTFDWEVTTLPGIVPDLLALEEAQQLLEEFRTTTVQQFPLILPSERDTFSTLATTKPTLLLAMITAASMSGHGELFKRLHEELTKRLAMKVIVGGERSIELVQALLVMEVWYCVPHGLEEGVNFYQWIHVAATMALQLGLGRIEWTDVKNEHALDRSMEEARILLAVWLSCSCVAVSLRRENMMKMTPLLQECLEKFEERAFDVCDKRLLAWVRLQMIAEEAQSVTPDQKHAQGSFLSRTSVTASQVYCLQRQLETWKNGLEPGILNETLNIHYLYCKAKILEVPLHAYHDLSALVVYPILCNNNFPHHAYQQIPATMAPVYMRVAVPFMDACYKLLDTFASMGADSLGNCPTVTFVRAVYSMSALRFVVNGPLLRDDVQVQMHIRDLHRRAEKALMAATGAMERQVPDAFLEVWRRIGATQQGRTTMRSSSLRMSGLGAIKAHSLDASQSTAPVRSYASSTLGTAQDEIFSGMDHQDIPDLDGILLAQGTLEHHTTTDTFINGFGSADLVF